MIVPFVKMHGAGNDYIYFDCVKSNLVANPVQAARLLSDRHFSVGGDGIVLILPHAQANFQMRMFNADGSESEMCGNAIRCVAKYVYDKGYHRDQTVRIMTGNGILTLHLAVANGVVTQVRVDMGLPVLAGRQIPVALDQPQVLGAPLTIGSEALKFTAVSMGNPHAVFFTDAITDHQVLTLGPQIEVHPLFPRRINVEWVQVVNRKEVNMRVWERGSGETLACGTGACAVGVAGVLNGLTERKITVHLRGGDLQIEWYIEDGHVYMSGPAAYAFTGKVELPD